MSFINSYKQLEKLCGEVLNDNRRISAYIDEMQNTPRGAFYVRSWNEDLKNLERYRWIRNQIAHEPDCDELNMCTPSDALWLDNFYSRIMNQTDPLALYRKATTPRTTPKQHRASTPSAPQSNVHKRASRRLVGCSLFLLTVFVVLIIVAFCLR